MKRLLVTILFIVLTIILLILPIKYITIEGINNIKESKSIRLTLSDIANKEKDIDNKYLDLHKELDKKYEDLTTEIKDKYITLINELDDKYSKNMLDDNWYEDEVKKMNEEADLNTKKNLEIFNLNKIKIRDENNLDKEKDNELKLLKSVNINSDKKFINGLIFSTLGITIDLIIVIYIIKQFNTLIKNNNIVKESLSNIDVMLKKRNDLIPNLVEIVKGYTTHEESTLKGVIEARNNALKSNNTIDLIKNSDILDNKINDLFVLVEKYPDLKANESYQNLQNMLVEVEEMIAKMRISYNKSVLRYKNKLEMFPSNIIAIICGFEKQKFYEIKDSERENIKISNL